MASVCGSPQCLISSLTQVGRGGFLFMFAYSFVLWGGRGAADKCHWRVWGALAVFLPHWVCPHPRHVCSPRLHCSGSRLLSREQALSCVHFPGPSSLRFRFLDTPHSVGPAFCAFPVPSSSGNQELDKRTLPRCSTTSLPIPASVSRCAGPVHHVSLLGS